MPRLAAMLAGLRRAERRLRTTSEDPTVLLERLVAECLLDVRVDLLGGEAVDAVEVLVRQGLEPAQNQSGKKW